MDHWITSSISSSQHKYSFGLYCADIAWIQQGHIMETAWDMDFTEEFSIKFDILQIRCLFKSIQVSYILAQEHYDHFWYLDTPKQATYREGHRISYVTFFFVCEKVMSFPYHPWRIHAVSLGIIDDYHNSGCIGTSPTITVSKFHVHTTYLYVIHAFFFYL